MRSDARITAPINTGYPVEFTLPDLKQSILRHSGTCKDMGLVQTADPFHTRSFEQGT